MYSYDFPMCCGFRILANFGGDWSNSYTSKEKLKEIRNILKKDSIRTLGPSYSMAILNNIQMKRFGHIFLEEGWEIIADDLYHLSHKHCLTVLIKQVRKSRRKTLPSWKTTRSAV